MDSPGGLTLSVEPDIPAADAGDPALAGPGGCRLLVQPIDGSLAISARTLGRHRLASAYRTRIDRRPNPEHAAARRQLARKGQNGLDLPKATGDVAIDLLSLAFNGVVSGVGALVDWRRDEDARERLEAAPAVIETPVFEPYELQLQTVELVRTARLRIALLGDGVFRAAEVPIEDRRTVEIARNLKADDRGRLEGRASYVAPAEVRALQKAPPALPAARLLRLAAAGLAGVEPRSGTEAALLAAWAAPPLPDPRQMTPAIAAAAAAPATEVQVEGMAGKGRGIYVGTDLVLTARSLVGDTALVRVEGPDRVVTYGVIEHEDPILDLALVYVQKRGSPVAIDTDAASAPAGWGSEPGTPYLQGGRLVGLAVAEAAEVTVAGRDLARFLAEAPGRGGSGPVAGPGRVAALP